MRKFNVTVNGTTYEVVVEEVKEKPGKEHTESSKPAPPTAEDQKASSKVKEAPPKEEPKKAEPAKEKEKKPEEPKPVANGEGAGTVMAPMPGTVLSIKVKEGDEVEQGQVLLVLEAMKMENEITSPRGGTVKSINAAENDSVGSGDVLVVIE